MSHAKNRNDIVFNRKPAAIIGGNPYAFAPTKVNTASAYIFQEYNTAEILTIQDTRDATVLSGLSKVGGIWSIGDKVLALLFVMSLMALMGTFLANSNTRS